MRAYPLSPFRLAATVAACLVGCAVIASQARAQAVTFGASLEQAPSAPFDCTKFPIGNGSTQNVIGNDSSCTWSTPVNPTVPQEGLLTPAGTGTIRAIHLRVGSTTGQMAIVVLQVEESTQTQSVSCCEASYVSPPFTPAANSTTTLPSEIPVHTDGAGEESSPGLQVGDILALSILEDGVPIPAVDETHSGLPPNETPSDDAWYPALIQGETALGSGTGGYQLDMNAEWVSGTSSPPPAPTVTFGHSTPTVGGGALHLKLGCGPGAPCQGSVDARAAPAHGAARESGKHAKKLVFAKGPFKLAAGAEQALKVPLTVAGRSAAKHHRRVKLEIEVSFAAGSSTSNISRRVTVRF